MHSPQKAFAGPFLSSLDCLSALSTVIIPRLLPLSLSSCDRLVYPFLWVVGRSGFVWGQKKKWLFWLRCFFLSLCRPSLFLIVNFVWFRIPWQTVRAVMSTKQETKYYGASQQTLGINKCIPCLHLQTHCKKDLLNCLQLTCRNHCADCTVTVPKKLHIQKVKGGVWMAAWLEHAACQLHRPTVATRERVVYMLAQNTLKSSHMREHTGPEWIWLPKTIFLGGVMMMICTWTLLRHVFLQIFSSSDNSVVFSVSERKKKRRIRRKKTRKVSDMSKRFQRAPNMLITQERSAEEKPHITCLQTARLKNGDRKTAVTSLLLPSIPGVDSSSPPPPHNKNKMIVMTVTGRVDTQARFFPDPHSPAPSHLPDFPHSFRDRHAPYGKQKVESSLLTLQGVSIVQKQRTNKMGRSRGRELHNFRHKKKEV
ncbi:putative signal peptide protein [Puccinia sorghi]|uniref:Putative signal peptide protein n=1 Tax=Puccinia sorghi TaxID=27349 RepID=A0A0L6UJU7_9BASI|nr:putative signal peptide protein [Puccinia sorghi]